MAFKLNQSYEFGPFRLDVMDRLLKCNGTPIPLTPKAFETLVMLVENNGHVVTKDDLLRHVWPNTYVLDGSLTRNISVLRKALGDENGEQYIETVPKHGYRFIGQVTQLEVDSSQLAPRSIAVLPFKHLNMAKGDEYLGLGMADALITKLSNIKQVTVRPTSAVRKYIGLEQDPVSVGKELRVECVLEGSIQRMGERVRVTVQFVSTRDGTPLWAEKFDDKFTDFLRVEDSISEQVARALMLKVSTEDRRKLVKHSTVSNEAYQAYLKGRYHLSRRNADGLKKGIEYFEQVIEIVPSYALAYVGLAECYALLGFHCLLAPRESFPKSKMAATKALEIDDTVAEAHTVLAYVKTCFDWDLKGAELEYNRAIALNPNYVTAHHWYSYYLTVMGRHEEAIVEIIKAQELDPLSLVINTAIGTVYYYSRDYERAVSHLLDTLEMDPNFVTIYDQLGRAYIQMGRYQDAIDAFQKAVTISKGNTTMLADLGCAYALAGKPDEAREVLENLRQLSDREYVSQYDVALVYTALGEKDSAFDWLNKAYEERYFELVVLKVEPQLDSLRSDPRFKRLMESVGLVH
jgi:DNA-binding winged helix-turn-helix (wHTH) protein/tetratricopeptide (TPR) repeat protein